MILAIETSSLVSSVALCEAHKLVGELTIQTRLTHSEQLMPHIKELMEKTKTTKEKIEAVAVSIGPGSFTGLRIGLATGKGLAFAWNVPMIAVPTMEGLAWNCRNIAGCICAVIDAQKGNVYETWYRWKNSRLETIKDTAVTAMSEVIEAAGNADEAVTFLGDGTSLFAEEIESVGGLVETAAPTMVIPRAGSVGLAAWQRFKEGKIEDCRTLVPYYIRRSEAEVLWEKRHSEGAC